MPAQLVHVANSTSSGNNAIPLPDDSCIIDITIECVDVLFDDVNYLYDVIITTNYPDIVEIEHSTLLSVIGLDDDRWRKVGSNQFAFYIVEPFDLQVTDCDGLEYNVLNWPDCGGCHVLHAITCDDDYTYQGIYYPYSVYISTNSPESVVIETNWPLVNLIALSDPRFTQPEENLYIIRYQIPFSLQMTDCSGNNFTANYWPELCGPPELGKATLGERTLEWEPVKSSLATAESENSLIDIHVTINSNRLPVLDLTLTEKDVPVSIYLIGVTQSQIRKEVMSNSYLEEGINKIILGELPFGLYQIIVQQGPNTKLIKYAHTYE